MNASTDPTWLERFISQLSAIENAMNEYRSNGSMETLYKLNADRESRSVLQKWLAYANLPELDAALNALDAHSISIARLSPYSDIMLHCQKEWDRPMNLIHIVYVHSGSFTCRMQNRTLTLQTGWCYIFNVNIRKEILPDSGTSELCNCLISQDYFENILLKQFDRTVLFSDFLANAFYTVNTSQPLLELDTAGNVAVRLTFSLAIVEQLNRDPLFESSVNGIVSSLMVQLIRVYMKDSDSNYYPMLGNNRLSEILIYIGENCGTATLAKVAERFHFNPNYLSRIIKNNTGQTFTQVLQNTRLKKTAALLRSTDMAVADIAQYVGYSNYTHFYQIFRKKYGVSPAEYRQNQKK